MAWERHLPPGCLTQRPLAPPHYLRLRLHRSTSTAIIIAIVVDNQLLSPTADAGKRASRAAVRAAYAS
jgi:hypothetical protein